MTIEDIENGTFKPKEYTFNEGEMHFIVSMAYNFLTDIYADYGEEDGEKLFQAFCDKVVEQFDETETGDVERVLILIAELVKKRG